MNLIFRTIMLAGLLAILGWSVDEILAPNLNAAGVYIVTICLLVGMLITCKAHLLFVSWLVITIQLVVLIVSVIFSILALPLYLCGYVFAKGFKRGKHYE